MCLTHMPLMSLSIRHPHMFADVIVIDIAGMAVTIDLGGKSAWGYDHPINKNEMSWRLARQAVHVAYAQQVDFFRSNPVSSAIWTGPELESV